MKLKSLFFLLLLSFSSLQAALPATHECFNLGSLSAGQIVEYKGMYIRFNSSNAVTRIANAEGIAGIARCGGAYGATNYSYTISPTTPSNPNPLLYHTNALYPDWYYATTYSITVVGYTCEDGYVFNSTTLSCELAPCPPNTILDTNTSMCAPLADGNNTYGDSGATSMEDTFYSDTPCPTVPEPNDYVPNALSADTANNYSEVGSWTDEGTAPPECTGERWKCNYETQTYVKMTLRLSGNLCYNDYAPYTGHYLDKTPAEKQAEVNPCDTKYKVMEICNNGYSGKCEHNGLVVTSNTLKCNEKPKEETEAENQKSDCTNSYQFYESFNESTGECQCDDGYSRNTWGKCTKNLNPLATPEEQKAKEVEEAKEGLAEAEAKEKALKEEENKRVQANMEATLSGVRRDLNSSTASNLKALDGVRSDLNVTNSILGELLKAPEGFDDKTSELAGIETSMDEASAWIDSIMAQYEIFGENVTEQIESVNDMFDNTKTLFQGGGGFTAPAGNTSNCFSFVFHGKTISLELCQTFSIFAPIFYYVFTLIFMILTFRFITKHLLKGLE